MPDDFGSQLRRARTRKGLDVNTVARRLRIRPDIIQAIEESDFDRMPPRGYARNMINSYAQLLGLNASEITRQYLDEQYAHQVNVARKNARGTGFDMPRTGRSATARAEAARMRQAHSSHYEVSGYELGDLSQPRNVRPRDRYRDSERPGRRMYDDYDSGRIMARPEPDRTYRNGGHRSRGRALGEEPIFNAVASPAPSKVFGNRFANVNWPLLGIVAVAVVLLIIVLVLAFGPKDTKGDVASLPVSVETETESSTVSMAGTAAAPTSFTFSYNVNSGTTTWIEVYIDGEKQIAQNVEGPSTKSFTTSGVLEFICADPAGVKAVQDGKDIPLTPNDKGYVDIKIDFNDVLTAWQVEHGLVSSSTTEVSGSSSSKASASSSSQSLRGMDTEAREAADEAAKEREEASEEESEEASDEESSEEGSEEEYTEDEYSEEEYSEEEYTEGGEYVEDTGEYTEYTEE